MTRLLDRPSVDRRSTLRRYVMCPPTEFAVSYAINPWMDISVPVDRSLALHQWEVLRQTYLDLGHEVSTIPAVAGLPDMVFAANGGFVVDGRALGASFTHPERQPEGPAYMRWFATAAADGELKDVTEPRAANEGEGDFLLVGRVIVAGYGFRTDLGAHRQVQELFGLPVISLELVDPRYYHLDTALAVLDDSTIAYFPEAFSEGSRGVLRSMFPDAVVASAEDAAVLGLNAVSDGLNVVLSAQATSLIAALEARGYKAHPIDLSELLKAGGSVKCCTLELRR